MNIAIVLPDLRLGGAEKNMINLANALQNKGHNVFLILIFGGESTIFLDISKDIEIIRLNLPKFRYLIFRPFKFINLVSKKKIDVLLGGYGELNPLIAIFSIFFSKVKFIARETSIPSIHIQRKILRIFYNITYNLFDVIIVQSESMKSDLLHNFRISPSKIALIPNILDTDKIDSLSKENIESNKLAVRDFILFVGTINENKRLDRVVDFHFRLINEGYDFDLVIIGDGPSVEKLNKLVIQKNIQNKVHLLGAILNPYPYMKKASFLIISSNYEGFPNVGIEAQYCGTPIILSENTLGGAKELILEGINGEIIDLELGNLDFIRKSYDSDKIATLTKDRHGLLNVSNQYQTLF